MKTRMQKHGIYAWMRKNSREGNKLDEHCCLRNNWRKMHQMAMFRKCNLKIRTLIL